MTVIMLFFGNLYGEIAEDRPAKAETVVTATTEEAKAQTTGETQGKRGKSDWEMAGRVVIYLVMLGVLGAFFVYHFKRGKFAMIGGNNKLGKLKVLETRSIGSRQYLVVVEYESSKFLLSVAPSGIRKIGDLGSKEVSREA